jgi:hypothetical protein
MPIKGDPVAYRSFAGDVWDAVVTGVWADKFGFVDVEVTGPGLKEPMALTAVRWSDDPESLMPGARPRRAAAVAPSDPVAMSGPSDKTTHHGPPNGQDGAV